MTEYAGIEIITFDSIHFVLAAERVLQERGLTVNLVPTPRELSTDCGMALTVLEEASGQARSLLSHARWRVRGFYRQDGNHFRRVGE